MYFHPGLNPLSGTSTTLNWQRKSLFAEETGARLIHPSSVHKNPSTREPLRSTGVLPFLTQLPCPGPILIIPPDRQPPLPRNPQYSSHPSISSAEGLFPINEASP